MAETLTLSGVKSTTLLGYLKGLGVLSILGRQDDPATSAAWRRDGFVLHGNHDEGSLERFFLERWEPAPVVSPWNGGSGFYPKDNTTGFEAIEASTDPRLRRIKVAINDARRVVGELGLKAKPEKAQKAQLLHALRAALADDALEWLDAAVVLAGHELRFPPLLGTGGNDGHYDISNNYIQCVAALFTASDPTEPLQTLRAALWAEPAALKNKLSLGHLARDSSPVNSPAGESDALGNPWDLVLAVSGAMLLAAGTSRRLNATGTAAAPFTLRAAAAGYGSAALGEKGRDELWMPTWRRPATAMEIQMMLREGRMQVGRRGAVSGLDGARAAAALGVARGLTGFQRFAILERAGQSNLAVPVGRLEVRANPAVDALATLDPWLSRMVARAGTDIPAHQRAATFELQQAAFALASDGRPANAARLMIAIGELEFACTLSGVDDAKPLRAKAAPWLALLWPDADPEIRLAVAFASLADDAHRSTLRAALLGAPDMYAPADGWRAPHAASITRQLAAVHERASLQRLGRPSYGQPASLTDIERLALGGLDERRIGALLRGLLALDWRGTHMEPIVRYNQPVQPALAHLALAFNDPREPPEPRVTPAPHWVPKLRGGRLGEVTGELLLRMRLSGLKPIADADDLAAGLSPLAGERLAAALLARPDKRELLSLMRTLTIDTAGEEDLDH